MTFISSEQELCACTLESTVEVKDKCYLCFQVWQTGQVKLSARYIPIIHIPIGKLLPIALLSQLQPIFYEDRFVYCPLPNLSLAWKHSIHSFHLVNLTILTSLLCECEVHVHYRLLYCHALVAL